MGPISSIAPKRRRATSLPGSGGTPRNAKAIRLLAAADQKNARQRDDLIASHMPMATRIARSFAGRGEDVDDLTQVALLELVRVASRFDPSLGATFARYAYPCIVGAVKKHFRDNGWSLHITRRMQELHLQTSRAIPGLTQILGRTPTVAELAIHLHLSEKDTRDGLHSRLAYRTRSLDQPANDDSESEFSRLLGGPDRRLEAIPDRQVLSQHLASMPARERLLLRLRFIDDLTQREIAERLGISQMHVSRLLSRSLENLRTMFLAQP